MLAQTGYVMLSDRNDDDMALKISKGHSSEPLAPSKIDAESRESCSGASAGVEADSDEAEDGLCSVPSSPELSTVIVKPGPVAGKRRRFPRDIGLRLGLGVSESDSSPKGSESLASESSTGETVSASKFGPASRADVSGVSKRMLSELQD